QAEGEMDHEEARFVYVGTYTRGAPGGWSAVASVNKPEGVMVFSSGAGMGDLQLIQTVPTDNPSWVTIHPSQDVLYVSNEIGDYEGESMGSIEAYAIDDETGELTLINRVATGSIPAQIVVSPGGDYLASANYVSGTYELFPIGEDGSLGEASSVQQQEGSGPHDRAGVSPRPCCRLRSRRQLHRRGRPGYGLGEGLRVCRR
ncbi:MAG: lactonase family protein, partial [Caldilineaceae bacterium]|nr:lactonase family protein [Caldilineaceae bacterium]